MATRVLYIDDEPDLREIACLGLGLDPNLEVKACASGRDGVEMLGHWAPAIILLDVMMPEMDGPTTLARIRETPGGANLPVVFVTAVSPSRGIEPLLALGAIGVIDKPFDPMTLAEEVNTYLERATEHDASGQDASAYDEHFDAVRKQFGERLIERVAELRLLADRSAWDWASMNATKRIAHEFAGTCGTFGYPALGEVGAELEEAADQALAGAGADVRPPLQRLITATDATIAEFTRA